MLVAILVNTFGLALCLWAYSRQWSWERGPLLLLRGSSIVLGIALSCTLAALLLEMPEALGMLAALAAVVALAAGVRRVNARRTPLASETVTVTPQAEAHPPRRTPTAQPTRTSGGWSSVTIRDIENMEVQP